MDASSSAPAESEVTRILARVSAEDPSAETRLFDVVYGELKRMAVARMALQAPGHTLQPTALVHEAYVRLLGDKAHDSRSYRDSEHFFSAAATAMRSILVYHARRRQARKRGGGALRLTLHPDLIGDDDPLDRILLVHEALDRLATAHPRTAKIVELLFFAGLTLQEAANVLGVSDRTVEREWRFARARLLWLIDGGSSA